MKNEFGLFHWAEPKPEEVGDCVNQFLNQLQQPTFLSQKGEDESRCRLIVTLLHGNEPSGLIALWHWLKSAQRPAVNSYFFIGTTEAAQAEPGFAVRHFLQLRDLNRCFDGPFDDVPGKIAKTLLQLIERLQPEAIIDVHNTSGSGPSFAVSFSDSPSHIAITSLFTERLLLTETRLGSLMEKTNESSPIVTIECGGAIDPESAQVAKEGLVRFLSWNHILTEPASDWQLEVLTDPLRITLTEASSISYAEIPCSDADLTLPPNIEHLNFGRIPPGTALGYLKSAEELCVQAMDGKGVDRTHEIFVVQEKRLISRVGLKVFMITTNPTIATSDCLCYAVIDNE